jgi:peptide/nickel transport system substrate-binding protein
MTICLLITLSSCQNIINQSSTKTAEQLVVATLGDPKTFNPALSQEAGNIFGYTMEGLITEDGDGNVQPALAESWEISPDKQKITFTLRPNLRWSNGEPLTSDDVDFTFNEVYFNEKIPADYRDILRIGKEKKLPIVKKLDDRRIEFTVSEPFAPFLRSLGVGILPAHKLRSTVQTKDNKGNLKFLSTWTTYTDPKELVSNGMYVLERYVPGERLIFHRNPYYWRKDAQGEPQPHIEKVIWDMVENTDTSLVKFRSGVTDVYGVGPEFFSLLKREEEKSKFKIYNGGPATGTTFMAFNLNTGRRKGKPLVDPVKSAWFNNVKFRQGIAYGIDRQRMVNNIYRGLGAPQNSPISVPSPYYLSPENGLKVYEYQPEKAKELLLSGGFKYNTENKLTDSNGNIVRFSLITNAGNKIRESMGSQIKEDLEKIGITVDFTPIDFNVLVDKLTKSLDWDAHIIGFTGGIEPNDGANFWNPDGGSHIFNQKPQSGQEPLEGQTVSDWERKIGDLYIQGAQELDENKRKEIYAETQRLAQEYLPCIYLVNPNSMSAIRDRIGGVKYSPIGGGLWNLYELKITSQ